MAKNATKHNLIYPLIDWDIEKEDVLDWWETQNFDLEIPEHLEIAFGVGKNLIKS